MTSFLPLQGLHRSERAAFLAAEGWELPARYTSAREEYGAARGSAGLADAGFLARFAFTGPDRADFLQGLLTCDVAGLAEGEGRLGCLLTPHGKILACFHIYNRGEDFLLVARPGSAAALSSALQKYLPLSETRMTDISGSQAAFYLTGPKAENVLKTMMGESPGDMVLSLHPYPGFGPEGRLLLAPASAAEVIWKALRDAGQPLGLRPVGCEALEILRIESGVPLPGQDIDAEAYPAEVNLEPALSLTKGCYLGQEITARLRNRGQLKRKLVGLRADEPFFPGPLLAGGAPAGTVTSAAESPRLGPVGLALVRSDLASETRLQAGNAGSEARIVPLPFPEG